VPARIEEEEFADDEGLDDHDRAGRNDCKQADDIEHSYNVEDDISRPSQRFSKTAHDGYRVLIEGEEVADGTIDVENERKSIVDNGKEDLVE
jgi:hypothetical protein